MQKWIFKYVIVLLLMCLSLPALSNSELSGSSEPYNYYAELQSPFSKQKWNTMVGIYAWLSGMNGDLTVAGMKSHVDLKPWDLFRLIDDLEFAGQAHIEMKQGRFSLMLDPTHVKIAPEAKMGSTTLNLNPSFTIIDFGIFYEVFPNTHFKQSNKINYEVLFGGRYMALSNRIKAPTFEVSGSEEWVSPIIGGRIRKTLSKNLAVWVRGDIGGFNVDNTKLTWSASAMLLYDIHPSLTLVSGLRALSQDHKTGSGSNRFAMDMILYGPVMGIILHD